MLRRSLSITLLVALTLFVAGVPRAMHWQAEHANAAALVDGDAQPTLPHSPSPTEPDGEDDCPDCTLHKAGIAAALGAASALMALESRGLHTPASEWTRCASFALPGAGPRAPPSRA